MPKKRRSYKARLNLTRTLNQLINAYQQIKIKIGVDIHLVKERNLKKSRALMRK
jgi:hypothetical protein